MKFKKTYTNKLTRFTIFLFSILMLLLLVINSNTLATGGNAVASDLLANKTATVDAGSITGTMPNKVGSATIITPSTADQVIPAGYYGGVVGDGMVAGVANAVSGNIKSGVTIAGITGSLVAGGAHSSQTYSTPGTYTFTVPADVYQVVIIVGGAGAGGGYGNNYPGGGGGGGGVYTTAVSVTPGQQISVGVGSGGAGSTAYPVSGVNGGNSYFGSYYGYGGTGGGSYTISSNGVGGAGGAGGGSGGSGQAGFTGLGPNLANYSYGGAGGYSIGGGSGGNGGNTSATGGAVNGVAGANGRVVIIW